ncbi:MAG TPA: flavin monoamine oxidase family protein [Caulobacteraceae bacterium]|jgi:monoamine oxidase|nr:flavin monoamine oxidase family protein [Caulobacteraceae bacterium]
MSRRLFLEKLSSVGGTALVLAGMSALGFGIESAMAAPPQLSGGGGKRILILGAGVAGLTAAYELSNAGYQVVVLEARTFAGGRSQSARKGFQLKELGGELQTCTFDEGLYINHGPWRLPYHHQSVLYYTKKFGVPLEVFVNDNDHSFINFTKGSGPLASKPVRKQEVAADIRGYATEMLAKCVQQGALDQQFGAGDKEMFLAYLKREGYLEGKDMKYLGTDGRGYDENPGAGVDPGPGKASTPHSLADILHSNTWRTLGSVANFEQQRTMFQPVGGMDRIPAGFVRNLGPVIRYSAKVEKISQDPGKVEVAYVDGKGQRTTVTGDYVLCTIPLSVLRNIDIAVSDRFKKAIGGASYAPVGKIGLQMKRRFWEEDHQIYGGHIYTDDPDIGSMTVPSTGFQGQKGVVLGYYNFGGNAAKVSAMTPAQRMAFAAAAGSKVMPAYGESVENAFSVGWHRVEHNLGGWAQWSDEGRRDDYPVLTEPDGRIYLAGEHLSYLGGWQAGGVESAWQQIAKIHKRVHAA